MPSRIPGDLAGALSTESFFFYTSVNEKIKLVPFHVMSI